MTKISHSFKTLFVFTSILLLATLNISTTNAQDSTSASATLSEQQLKEYDKAPEIKDLSILRAKLNQYTQDPASKEVLFEIVLSSQVDSDRVKVTWAVSGASRFAEDTISIRDIKIEKGKTYTIPVTLLPVEEGVTELYGKVESFEVGNSFIVTVRKHFASNIDGDLLPETSEYKNAKLMLLIKRIVTYVGVFLVLILGSAFGVKKFAKWYNKDEVKDYEDSAVKKDILKEQLSS